MTVQRLVRDNVSVMVKFRVRIRDMVKLNAMDNGEVIVSIRVRVS